MGDTFLELPLREIYVNDVLRDVAGNRRNATANGDVRIVEDDTFGTCVAIGAGSITTAPLRESEFPRGMTVLVWYRTDPTYRIILQLGGVLGVELHPNQDQQVQGDVAVVYAFNDKEGVGWVRLLWAPHVVGEWQILSAVFGSDGRLVGATLPYDHVLWPREWDTPIQITIGHELQSEPTLYAARLRIYDRALDEAEIAAIRLSDLARPPVRTSGLPVSLSLEDDSTAASLPLDTPRTMALRATPNVDGRVRLAALASPVSADNWHFRVAFRQGVLRGFGSFTASGMDVLASSGDGEDVLCLRVDGSPVLPLAIPIPDLCADGRLGERLTRVTLAYRNVLWNVDGADVWLTDTRSQQLLLVRARATRPEWTPLNLDPQQDAARVWSPMDGDPPRFLQDANGLVHLRGRLVGMLQYPFGIAGMDAEGSVISWGTEAPMPDAAVARLQHVPRSFTFESLDPNTRARFEDWSHWVASVERAGSGARLSLTATRADLEATTYGGSPYPVKLVLTLDGLSYWGAA